MRKTLPMNHAASSRRRALVSHFLRLIFLLEQSFPYVSIIFSWIFFKYNLLIELIGIAGLPFVSDERKLEAEQARTKFPDNVPVSLHTTLFNNLISNHFCCKVNLLDSHFYRWLPRGTTRRTPCLIWRNPRFWSPITTLWHNSSGGSVLSQIPNNLSTGGVFIKISSDPEFLLVKSKLQAWGNEPEMVVSYGDTAARDHAGREAWFHPGNGRAKIGGRPQNVGAIIFCMFGMFQEEAAPGGFARTSPLLRPRQKPCPRQWLLPVLNWAGNVP